MSYLIVTRSTGQRIRITANPGAEDAELLRLLRSEGIDVVVNSISGRQVKLGFEAPTIIRILREELTSNP
ncbi:TPA: carbon storage regulator [Pseudomonas aeruginosa]|uniref:carbon storage regulator n=1 Tax=Pseudomonas paraeruginosa TaxID=2994495 RepID=UPI00374935FE|nr:carbon storage regulator [Pseudomonas aeruginosa]